MFVTMEGRANPSPAQPGKVSVSGIRPLTACVACGRSGLGAADLGGRRAGFTLVEVLIALVVVSVLLGVLLPSLSGVREHARRIVCGSNERQIGLAIQMWADQSQGYLPPSMLLGDPNGSPVARQESYRPQDMVMVRVGVPSKASLPTQQAWDGLGLLFAEDYLPAAAVFYCPSHRGTHTLAAYESQWHGAAGEIVSNYHYRGQGPNGMRRLDRIDPFAALVTDSLRSLDEINHEGGLNVLQAGLTVEWSPDDGGRISDLLRMAGDDGNATTATTLWQTLDANGSRASGNTSGY